MPCTHAMHLEGLRMPVLPLCAVLQIIAAVLVPKTGAEAAAAGALSAEAVRAWAAERLPRYELPDVVRVVPGLGRNAMGKVNKRALKAELFPPPAS